MTCSDCLHEKSIQDHATINKSIAIPYTESRLSFSQIWHIPIALTNRICNLTLQILHRSNIFIQYWFKDFCPISFES